MSDSAAGFAQFVPGFDFLQSLAKGASSGIPQMPQLANWVAPTLNPEELDKRIAELKAVHFWLEQNARALGATIQALEVQKLTLATLHGMNVGLGEVAEAFKLKPVAPAAAAPSPARKAPASEEAPPPEAPAKPAKARSGKAAKDAAAPASLADPLQFWGALTQQFQQIASAALHDVAKASEAAEPALRQDAAPPAAKPATPARKARPAGAKAARSASRSP